MSNYSEKQILDALVDHLKRNDCKHSVKNGIIESGFRIGGPFGSVRVVISPEEDCFNVFAFSKLNADPENKRQMANMALFLTRANYGLKAGNFEMDCRDGEIRYKTYVDCEDGLPTDNLISNAIGIAVAMVRRYAPGIIQVLVNHMDPEKAVESSEHPERFGPGPDTDDDDDDLPFDVPEDIEGNDDEDDDEEVPVSTGEVSHEDFLQALARLRSMGLISGEEDEAEEAEEAKAAND